MLDLARPEPYLMHEMIMSQPAAFRETLRKASSHLGEIAGKLAGKERILLSGCGTSYYAALIGASMISAGTRNTAVSAVHAFELLHYELGLRASDAVLVVSHSGSTKTSFDALKKSRESGAYCVTITWKPESPIGKLAENIIPVCDTHDKSWANTKSYTCSLLGILLLTSELLVTSDPAISRTIRLEAERLPATLEQILPELDTKLSALAEAYREKRRFYFIGSGPNEGTAYEAALKMTEANYTCSVGLETEQIIHGPFGSVSEKDLVIAIAPPGASHSRSRRVLEIANQIGAETFAIVEESDEEIKNCSMQSLEMPSVHELLSPILYVVPLHLLTYHITVANGLNPDFIHLDDPRYAGAKETLFEEP